MKFLIALMVCMFSVGFLSHANASECEGTFQIVPGSLKIKDKKDTFTARPGEVGGSVCPKNLYVEQITQTNGSTILASTSSDLVGTSPHDEIMLGLNTFSKDLMTAVSSGFLLANFVNDTGGSAMASRDNFPQPMGQAMNSISCDANGISIMMQAEDDQNDYSVSCSYTRSK
jgi:hypothetical protein